MPAFYDIGECLVMFMSLKTHSHGNANATRYTLLHWVSIEVRMCGEMQGGTCARSKGFLAL